ncbi:TonB-dependent receptor [Flammeovirga agarivorans]|uniref:TonB-dependent receptor n=1 Tax=Flammeovirga agarivorans TaxID=2726742 RepID=A0A7X8SGJ9_9BACT|nr:TonB-dependent receptor [Flammeovirga agarivorans]NLR89859.1 TonB-dependent receptor [Flammeovirga agarivorans]
MKITTTIFLILLPLFSWAQSQLIKIEVIDNEQKPMIGAHVCLLSSTGERSYYTTNQDGKTELKISEQTKCIVSYTGFKTTELELSKPGTYAVKLKPDLLMLDQVVKTASVEPQKVDESIYKIEVINGPTLEKMGVQTIQDALRFQPNINLQQDGVLGTRIIMQGLEGQHVKILIDGMPVVGRQGGNIDLSQLDAAQIDHIEIIEGPMSVVYGSNALAGTINIITKENKYHTVQGVAKVYGESVGLVSGDVNVSGVKKNHKWGISGGTRLFNGFDPDKSTRSMSFNPKDQYNADVYYGYKFSGWDTKVGVRFGREDLTLVGDYTSPTNPVRAFDSNYITDRITYYGQFNKQFNNGDAFQGMVSYNTYDRHGQQYFVKINEGTETPQGDPSHDAFQTLNTRLSYAKQVNDWWKVNAGYELTDETGSGDKMDEGARLTENAIWTDMNMKISERWAFQPGARFIHHSQFGAPLIYSAHVKYDDKSSWAGRLSFAKGFRAPSLKEMYMNFVDSNHEIYGNPDLQAETSYSLTGNISKNLELSESALVRLEASAFYNHLNDVIELAQGEDGRSYIYTNVSQKKTQGGTFKATYNNNNKLKIDAGVTLTGIGYDLYNEGNFDFRYSTDLVSSVSYFWPQFDLSARLDYKYTGARVQLTVSDVDAPVEEGTVDAYNMLNFSSTKNFKNKKYAVTAGVKNILDVTDVTNTTNGGAHSGGTSMLIAWGRTYFVSFKVAIGKP